MNPFLEVLHGQHHSHQVRSSPVMESQEEEESLGCYDGPCDDNDHDEETLFQMSVAHLQLVEMAVVMVVG